MIILHEVQSRRVHDHGARRHDHGRKAGGQGAKATIVGGSSRCIDEGDLQGCSLPMDLVENGFEVDTVSPSIPLAPNLRVDRNEVILGVALDRVSTEENDYSRARRELTKELFNLLFRLIGRQVYS